MNLAIQRLQQLARETEVKLEHTKTAHEVHQRTAAESAAEVVSLTALLADLKAAITLLPVASLRAVPFSVPASEVQPVEPGKAVMLEPDQRPDGSVVSRKKANPAR